MLIGIALQNMIAFAVRNGNTIRKDSAQAGGEKKTCAAKSLTLGNGVFIFKCIMNMYNLEIKNKMNCK